MTKLNDCLLDLLAARTGTFGSQILVHPDQQAAAILVRDAPGNELERAAYALYQIVEQSCG